MKVLTIKQPYASLIANKYKTYEFRSWKTNYRGELYIHAGNSIDKKRKELVKNYNLNYPTGYIIAKVRLTDCILVSKKMNKYLRKKNPKVYTHDYTGYYAWKLENIEMLKAPVKASGQLSIWNFYSINEIINLMDKIEYGWLDKNNNKHDIVDNTYQENYILETPQEVIQNKIGVCWDQVELERYYLRNHDLNIKTYFLVHYDNDKCPTHTFLTYEKDNKYYWFEHAWMKFKGIHEYSSKTELLTDVRNKFIMSELKNHHTKENLVLYEYQKPKYHISTQEFFKHCERGKQIEIESR